MGWMLLLETAQVVDLVCIQPCSHQNELSECDRLDLVEPCKSFCIRDRDMESVQA